VNLGRGALGHHRRITVATVRTRHGEEELVAVEDPECLPPHTLVVVTVEAPARRVVPSLLRSFGICLSDDDLAGQTALRKE
jgi:hypothetical protein